MFGDINGDGHVDFTDYVIYQGMTDSNDSGGSPNDNGGCSGCLTVLLIIAVIYEVIKFLVEL